MILKQILAIWVEINHDIRIHFLFSYIDLVPKINWIFFCWFLIYAFSKFTHSLEKIHLCAMCNFSLLRLKDLIIYKFKLKTKLEKKKKADCKFCFIFFGDCYFLYGGRRMHMGLWVFIFFKGLKSLLLLNSSPLLRCNLPSIWPQPNNSISETPGLWAIYFAQITSILF